MRSWDVANGRLLRTFSGHTDWVSAVAFSPDGSRAVSGSSDKTLKIWDAKSGRYLRTFGAELGGISSVAFSPNGQRLLSSSDDGAIRLWEANSGELVATFLASKDAEWIAITPEGFFASSSKGTDMIAVVRGLEVITIDQVHQSLFNPDLVREKLAGDPSGEVHKAANLVNLEKVISSGPAPSVTIEAPTGNTETTSQLVNVKALIHDRGKGVGRVEWRVNGVTAAVITKTEGDAREFSISKELALDPGDNIVEVVAYNASNLLASQPARTFIKFNWAQDEIRPTLHVLAIGINKYQDQGGLMPDTKQLTLFKPLFLAVRDAELLAEEFRRAAGTLYREVKITFALDEEATRHGLSQAVARMGADIHPRDTFVFFAAAHGYSHAGNFFLIPQDYSGGGDPFALQTRAIGQLDLQDWLANRIKAKRAVILLDTCESGALIAGHLRSRVDSAASEAGIGRLHEATGRPVLTAAALGQFAFEGLVSVSGTRQGLFTYAVLDALRNGDFNRNGSIELTEMVGHVQTLVPKLAAELGGSGRAASATQRPPGAQQTARFGSRGENFSLIGRLDGGQFDPSVPSPIADTGPARNQVAALPSEKPSEEFVLGGYYAVFAMLRKKPERESIYRTLRSRESALFGTELKAVASPAADVVNVIVKTNTRVAAEAWCKRLSYLLRENEKCVVASPTEHTDIVRNFDNWKNVLQ